MKGVNCGVSMPMLETFEDEPKPKAATASPPQMKVSKFKLHHYFLLQERVINCDCLQYFFVFMYLCIYSHMEQHHQVIYGLGISLNLLGQQLCNWHQFFHLPLGVVSTVIHHFKDKCHHMDTHQFQNYFKLL